MKKWINLQTSHLLLLSLTLLSAERKWQNEAVHILWDYLFWSEPKHMFTNDLQEHRDVNRQWLVCKGREEAWMLLAQATWRSHSISHACLVYFGVQKPWPTLKLRRNADPMPSSRKQQGSDAILSYIFEHQIL